MDESEIRLIVDANQVGFGVSISIDIVWNFTFAEDGAKFAGQIFWVVYYFDTANTSISENMQALP
jgi:hypothetical protein